MLRDDMQVIYADKVVRLIVLPRHGPGVLHLCVLAIGR
jgi:hypothetical protein